jgi:hypothetical protein
MDVPMFSIFAIARLCFPDLFFVFLYKSMLTWRCNGFAKRQFNRFHLFPFDSLRIKDVNSVRKLPKALANQ